jgi:hypothetical protein
MAYEPGAPLPYRQTPVCWENYSGPPQEKPKSPAPPLGQSRSAILATRLILDYHPRASAADNHLEEISLAGASERLASVAALLRQEIRPT